MTRSATRIRRIVVCVGAAALLLMLAEPAAAQCRSTKRPGWLQRALGVGVGESIRDSLRTVSRFTIFNDPPREISCRQRY